LLEIVFPYLESLHSFRMQVYKFIKSNPLGNIIDMLPSDL
jgi:hypothetical protein